MNSIDRVTQLTNEWVRAFCLDRNLSDSSFSPKRPLTQEEAKGIIRAIDEGFISIEKRGRVTLPGLRKSTEYHLIKSMKVGFDRVTITYGFEWFTHIAVVHELVADFGWPRSLIDFETLPFDAVAYENDNVTSPVLVTEVKASVELLDQLLDLLRRCSDDKVAFSSEVANNDYRKYWGLLGMKVTKKRGELVIEKKFDNPKWLLVAAPGVRKSFRVQEVNGVVRLEPITLLPNFSEI